jgi:hypothetical protein
MNATRATTNDEITEFFGLPELPETVEDTDDYEDGKLAQLAISQFDGDKIYLDGEITLADAQAYCDDEATHDKAAGWFVMFYRR